MALELATALQIPWIPFGSSRLNTSYWGHLLDLQLPFPLRQKLLPLQTFT